MTHKYSLLGARRDFKRLIGSANTDSVAIALKCPKCNTIISGTMKWRCANCGFDNQRTELYSFLNKCQKCENVPGAVVCPRCSTMICLTDERDAQFAARQMVEERKTPPKVDPSQKATRAHSQETLRLQREIEIERLKGELIRTKRLAEPKAEQTEDEKMDAAIGTYVARIMGQHKAVSRAKEQAAIDYKDDADGLEKVLMALDQWREAHIQP